MTTFLSQLPALIGVLIGTIGTLLTTRLNDRAQWDRALSARWDERRLDAYAECARTLKEVQLLATRVTAPSRPESRSLPIDRTTGLELLAQADAQHTKAWEAVLLMGDANTVAAAREWRMAVMSLGLAARGTAGEDFDWGATVQRADYRRDGFYEAARASLTIGPGNVAQARWLDARRSAH
ncbi:MULTISPECIES: hypothetical protein [unclassified Streptomyces]|uniref:hypothetical protein n=1 Tax=unclassified Streptomyces TaxID=2593676 RepID=UPI0028884180|nr:hypothetical protein [Streptomyces sp. DSM 41633]